MLIGLFEIHGELHGEKMDTSTSQLEMIFAELEMKLLFLKSRLFMEDHQAIPHQAILDQATLELQVTQAQVDTLLTLILTPIRIQTPIPTLILTPIQTLTQDLLALLLNHLDQVDLAEHLNLRDQAVHLEHLNHLDQADQADLADHQDRLDLMDLLPVMMEDLHLEEAMDHLEEAMEDHLEEAMLTTLKSIWNKIKMMPSLETVLLL